MNKTTNYFGICLALVILGSTSNGPVSVQVPQDEFHAALARAANLSTLAEPNGEPFHLKLVSQDTTLHNPAYTAEIEVWWAAPDKWRRRVKSSSFTQLAIQNGARYFESNPSADYLPYWLHELIEFSVSPVPTTASVNPDGDPAGCEHWEDFHGSGEEQFSTYDSVCFAPDGTVGEVIAGPIGISLGNYQWFGNKKIARRLTVWPGDRSDSTATITVLEPLENWQPSLSDPDGAQLFDVSQDTGLATRIRFVSVAESLLLPADDPLRKPLVWPSSYTFPVNGLIAVTVDIDRSGNVRQIPFTISKNQAINEGAVKQISSWKFKPYVVDGAPVQVVTTLLIPYHLKYEPLGANGKEFPPISFVEHIEKSRALSDLRTQGSPPFHLRGTFALTNGQSGTYEETWENPDEWTRQVGLADAILRVTRADGRNSMSVSGDAPSRVTMLVIGAAIQDHLPNPGTFHEGDWGNSAVPETNVYPTNGPDTGEPVLIRAARGSVDPNNHPTSGEAYWFDSKGLLRATFADGIAVVNSHFEPWNKFQVPRRFEIFSGSTLVTVLTVDSIESR